MRLLPIHTLGMIVGGEEKGRVVEILDDAANTGGFLILTYANVRREPEVFDAWVETIVDVDSFFDDRGWEVEWLEGWAQPASADLHGG